MSNKILLKTEFELEIEHLIKCLKDKGGIGNSLFTLSEAETWLRYLIVNIHELPRDLVSTYISTLKDLGLYSQNIKALETYIQTVLR